MDQLFKWEAPAKINLTLDVLFKRADGYHELRTIMHKIDLVDRISMKKAEQIIIRSNDASIAWDETNLVYRAARLISETYDIGGGAEIYVEKQIPIGAGLAGGSTDAAATLTGINQLYNLNLNYEQLADLAQKIGSDVTFCLNEGPATALAQGRGEILTPLEMNAPLIMVLVKPDIQISTAEVYGSLDLEQVKIRPDNDSFIQASSQGLLKDMATSMANVLETVSIKKYPVINRIKERLMSTGAIVALMSGSGPSTFGLFADHKRAQLAANELKSEFAEVFLVSSYFRGGQ